MESKIERKQDKRIKNGIKCVLIEWRKAKSREKFLFLFGFVEDKLKNIYHTIFL